MDFFSDYSFYTLFFLAAFAFIAGFLDAIVGGGGLIQLPALLIQFPQLALPTLFGTNKIAALSGTSIAAVQYAKRIRFNWKVLLSISLFSFLFSFLGARTVSYLDSEALKPLILIILIAIAIYTFIKKDLGNVATKDLSTTKKMIFGALIGAVIGFYDGFFGPGTGSFFVLAFVVILGFDFLSASAYAKVVNCITNISALLVFVRHGNYLLELAILMAVFNVLGNFQGTKIAFKKGNGFIRIVFLIIVMLMILRYSKEVFLDLI